jgi:hypothetical protein
MDTFDQPWPELPLRAWEPTYLTLHRWTQILGKVALALAPVQNHWWHVTLRVGAEGLVTAPLPVAGRLIELGLDFRSHRLRLRCSDGRDDGFDLQPMSVAEFYARTLDLLASIEVRPRIRPVPVEVADTTPFTEDQHHRDYDPVAVQRLHRILISSASVFARHRGRFLGKSSPVHFFWGAFDLAVTRFTGRPNPGAPEDPVMREAYSQEVVSHGFWPGGDWALGGRVEEPIFYAYAVPEPAGFASARVVPEAARYERRLGEWILPYAAVRGAADPEATLLEFLESSYQAAARPLGLSERLHRAA